MKVMQMMAWVTLCLFSRQDGSTPTRWPSESQNKELCACKDFPLSIWDKLQVFKTLIPSLISSHLPCFPCKSGDNIYLVFYVIYTSEFMTVLIGVSKASWWERNPQIRLVHTIKFSLHSHHNPIHLVNSGGSSVPWSRPVTRTSPIWSHYLSWQRFSAGPGWSRKGKTERVWSRLTSSPLPRSEVKLYFCSNSIGENWSHGLT